MAQLHPTVVTLWRIAWIITALTATAFVGISTVTFAVVGVIPWWLAALLPVLCFAAGAVAAVVLPGMNYRGWRYDVLDDALEIRHGVLLQVHSVIPYFRVQHIDVRCGPIERALGMRSLVVRTAAATTDAKLPGIGANEADDLRRTILERAGRDDAV